MGLTRDGMGVTMTTLRHTFLGTSFRVSGQLNRSAYTAIGVTHVPASRGQFPSTRNLFHSTEQAQLVLEVC